MGGPAASNQTPAYMRAYWKRVACACDVTGPCPAGEYNEVLGDLGVKYPSNFFEG